MRIVDYCFTIIIIIIIILFYVNYKFWNNN